MKFSTRTLYGLKAILVLASRYGEGSLPVSQIARKEGISIAYLEQILHALKRKGVVKSLRGPQGGYVLAKKPSDITLQSLLTLLTDKPFLAQGGKSSFSPDSDEVALANDDRLVAELKGRQPGLDHEHLGVGVPMQPRANARRGVHEDDRERDIAVILTHEFVRMRGVRQVVEPDDWTHRS